MAGPSTPASCRDRHGHRRLSESYPRERAKPGAVAEDSDLFGQISSSNRLAFVEHLQLARLSAGQVLIRAGEDPDRMFLLASGTAEITVSGAAGPRVIHRISPGETLGAIGLITDSPHKAAATALTEMTA